MTKKTKKKKNKNRENKKTINNGLVWLLCSAIIIVLIVVVVAISYAFFNYTRTGPNNTAVTERIEFDFEDVSTIDIGNAFPIGSADIDNNYECTFTITSHTTISNGISYRIYAIPGVGAEGKTNLLDSVMSLQFIPASNGNGFTTLSNNYNVATSPQFIDGKALISTGIVKNTTDLTTKTYTVKLWIDSSKILISSTTKRANNAEGNPSLADTTTGNVIVGRYIKNDGNLVSTTLYPAESEYEGKIVYTTNEFKNAYYSIKIVVEATNALS